MMNLQLKVPPVLVVLFFGMLMWGINRMVAPDWLTFHTAIWIPAGMVATGCLFGAIGFIQFYRHATSIDPRHPGKASSLITGGIYRFSRNPMYVELLLILAGYGVYLGNLLTFAVLPLFVLYINRFQIVPEEEIMESKFGERYLQYKNEVRRWL